MIRIKRWLEWAVLLLVAGFVAVYTGDWAIYKLRGSPHDKVTVNRYVTIPLKGRKMEYDYQGTVVVPCAIALFPQEGQSPCWRVRRDTNQGMTL